MFSQKAEITSEIQTPRQKFTTELNALATALQSFKIGFANLSAQEVNIKANEFFIAINKLFEAYKNLSVNPSYDIDENFKEIKINLTVLRAATKNAGNLTEYLEKLLKHFDNIHFQLTVLQCMHFEKLSTDISVDPSLNELPNEILFAIAKHLSPTEQLKVRSTSKRMQEIVDKASKRNIAVMFYFDKYLKDAMSVREYLNFIRQIQKEYALGNISDANFLKLQIKMTTLRTAILGNVRQGQEDKSITYFALWMLNLFSLMISALVHDHSHSDSYAIPDEHIMENCYGELYSRDVTTQDCQSSIESDLQFNIAIRAMLGGMVGYMAKCMVLGCGTSDLHKKIAGSILPTLEKQPLSFSARIKYLLYEALATHDIAALLGGAYFANVLAQQNAGKLSVQPYLWPPVDVGMPVNIEGYKTAFEQKHSDSNYPSFYSGMLLSYASIGILILLYRMVHSLCKEANNGYQNFRMWAANHRPTPRSTVQIEELPEDEVPLIDDRLRN